MACDFPNKKKKELEADKGESKTKKTRPSEVLYQMLLARVLRMLQSYAGLGAKYEIKRLLYSLTKEPVLTSYLPNWQGN